MSIKDDFMNKTKMIDINGEKTGVEQMICFLTKPEVINKMIIASELELPVLTLIARDIEFHFDENSKFPVVFTENSKNATYRQNVGRMIKFVMSYFGFTPIYGGLTERTRIPAISGSKFFSTCAIYKKTSKHEYTIEVINKRNS